MRSSGLPGFILNPTSVFLRDGRQENMDAKEKTKRRQKRPGLHNYKESQQKQEKEGKREILFNSLDTLISDSEPLEL